MYNDMHGDTCDDMCDDMYSDTYSDTCRDMYNDMHNVVHSDMHSDMRGDKTICTAAGIVQQHLPTKCAATKNDLQDEDMYDHMYDGGAHTDVYGDVWRQMQGHVHRHEQPRACVTMANAGDGEADRKKHAPS